MTKAQAILLAPVLAYVFLAQVFVHGGSLRQALRMWPAALAAATTVVLIASPFVIGDHYDPEGGWQRWFQRSYVEPIREQFPYSTVRAFNVWWLDFVAHDQEAAALQPQAAVLGVAKGTLGHLLLACAVLAGGVLCARRWRWEPASWPAFAFVVMFAAFVLPTRVHERYIYYCLPFLVSSAVVFHRWIPLIVTLFLVGGFEMTWYMWLADANASLDAPAQSPGATAWSTVLAVLTVSSLVYALIALLPWRARSPKPKPQVTGEPGRSRSMFGSPPG
jgi:hypothetical protein